MFLNDYEKFSWWLTIFRVQHIYLRMAMTNRELRGLHFCIVLLNVPSDMRVKVNISRGEKNLWFALYIPRTRIFWKNLNPNHTNTLVPTIYMYPWGCLLLLETAPPCHIIFPSCWFVKIISIDCLPFSFFLKIFSKIKKNIPVSYNWHVTLLRCTTCWSDTLIYCRIITARLLVNTPTITISFLWWGRLSSILLAIFKCMIQYY